MSVLATEDSLVGAIVATLVVLGLMAAWLGRDDRVESVGVCRMPWLRAEEGRLMSQAGRSIDRTASAKRPLSTFFESSTPAYLVGAAIGVLLAAALILGLATVVR